ncbi:carbohydrate ABC transporter permease [Lachnospiraceae bacterium ASD4241]|uniref:Carbohydrate ABC transporter permease n=2 Tax=Diplocloster modestus TaxID=2850322 RepID=A0ABS6KB88_9FIRM|nr:carbohydrate ABC transporter permease [Diplocloster modestus]
MSKVVLVVIGISFLYPLLWMFLLSFKSKTEFYVNPFGMPTEWVFTNYAEVLKQFPIVRYFLNSVIYTMGTCALTLFLGSMLAYSVTRMNWRYSNKVLFYMSVGLVIPVQVVMIPLYTIISGIGLKGTPLALILPYSAFQLPSTVLMLHAFLRSLPGELEEAAAIDGCNVYQGFFRIMLPVIRPAVVTRGVFIFINIWNEFSLSQVLANSPKLSPLPVGLQSFFLTIGVSNWGLIGAAMILTSIPLILIYCFGNRQIENALTAGAVLK